MKTMLTQFKAARRVSTPLVAITTPDPAATINAIKEIYETNGDVPMAQWDILRGVTAINELAVDAVDKINEGEPAGIKTGNPSEALAAMLGLPEKTIIFFHNAHLYLQGQDDSRKPIIQGIWNARDKFKADKRMIVMLCPQIQLPAELSNDVLVLDEPLPTEAELTVIVTEQFETATATEQFKQAKIKMPSADLVKECVSAVAGLAAFPAEQAVAMSMTPNDKRGIDLMMLWERKRQAIENAGGLKVFRGDSKFANLIGVDNAVEFMRMVNKGKRKPKLFVLLDEAEKQMAGQNSTDGTSTDQVGVLLTAMEDYGWSGVIYLGFSGAGKTELFKATAGEADAVAVTMDLGGAKSKFVGESEARIRNMVKTLYAMGGQDVFFIATCNNSDALKPEFKQRFGHGTFFFDLPGEEQLKGLTDHYMKVYGLKGKIDPADFAGWTGRNIKRMCSNADELEIPMDRAASFVTSVARSMGEAEVEALRKAANGKYINASKPGVYKMPFKDESKPRRAL